MNNNQNENGSALICIPDITGFTRFMAENDLVFSRKIIPPLLRTIVSSNNLNMKVQEIEGDAVVFYRFGLMPTLNDMMAQCLHFYHSFNEQLAYLTNEYADDFHQHVSSNKLSLKIIIHSAEIISTQIEGITKLIGEDMVRVHKLLKNSITDMEYILMTDKFLSGYTEEEKKNAFNGYRLTPGTDEYEYIGSVSYHYIPLTLLPPPKETDNSAAKESVTDGN